MHAPGAYAASLLAALPPVGAVPPAPRAEHPALAWARSGAMALTGRADEPPRLAPAPLAGCAAAALDALRALAATSGGEASGADVSELDGASLLGERAAYLGLARRGSLSPGGSCRLLRAADGWIAASLPREDDRALIPAWLGDGEHAASDPWGVVAARVAERQAADVVARARLLGLAVAEAGAAAGDAPPWFRAARRKPRRAEQALGTARP